MSAGAEQTAANSAVMYHILRSGHVGILAVSATDSGSVRFMMHTTATKAAKIKIQIVINVFIILVF
jgi:hypothetical protein